MSRIGFVRDAEQDVHARDPARLMRVDEKDRRVRAMLGIRRDVRRGSCSSRFVGGNRPHADWPIRNRVEEPRQHASRALQSARVGTHDRVGIMHHELGVVRMRWSTAIDDSFGPSKAEPSSWMIESSASLRRTASEYNESRFVGMPASRLMIAA
jgi:hypothetical protein